jgi:MFS family permease
MNFGIGMCCVVSTIYLTDISPRSMRGKVVTFHQLFIVIGVLMGQIVGIPWLLGQQK